MTFKLWQDKRMLLGVAAGFIAGLLPIGLAAAWFAPGRPSLGVPVAPAAIGAVRHEERLNRDMGAIREELAQLKADVLAQQQATERYQTDRIQNEEVARLVSKLIESSIRRPRKGAGPAPVRAQAIGQSVKEMKELSDYVKDVARTMGVLDAVMSGNQQLVKKPAEPQKAAVPR